MAGATAGGAILVWRRRQLADLRLGLERAAARPRVRVGAVREQGLRLERQAELWSKTTVGRTADVLGELRHRARSAGGETERSAALLSQALPEGIEEASREQVDHARRRLTELEAALDHQERALDELSALGARLDHLRLALPAKHELLVGELAESKRLARRRAGEDWVVDEPRAELARVEATLGSIDLNHFALDSLTLAERIEAIEAQLFAADHDLQSLPDRPASLATWRQHQVEASALEQRRIDAARKAIVGLSSTHSADSWQWASDYPDRAQHLLREAATQGDEAIEDARVTQRFDDSGKRLEQAGLKLMAADDLLDQIDDLLIDLEEARSKAPAILAEGRRLAEVFGQYVEQHRGDLDRYLVNRPPRVEEMLAGLELELTQARPNYLRVAEAGYRLNQEIDELLATAEDQHERMEALRRQAIREVERAHRNIRRAEQSLGWQLFPSRDARRLQHLWDVLGSLPHETEARLATARNVGDEAVAIQERIIAERRRSGNWVTFGNGGGGGSTWSSGGAGSTRSSAGGGARSPGGRSAGRGGSRSFGGGRSPGGW